MSTPLYSRRRFLHQLVGTGALAVTGLDRVLAAPGHHNIAPQTFRFAFLTDIHLLADNDLRCNQGLITCLKAVQKLKPKADFILVGGDVVDRTRDLTILEADSRYAQFLQLWNDHTSLPAYWTIGNHELVGVNNPSVSTLNPYYGKRLFEERFNMPNLYYTFDFKGWHFVVLDDVSLLPNHHYTGDLFDEEVRYLTADLNAHRNMPTILCTHIPILSNMPLALHLIKAVGIHVNEPQGIVCDNAKAVTSDIPGHNIRAVLAGHLHRYEKLSMDGVPFINSGAVCGNYWRGPMLGCPEGFGVVDLESDGTVAFDYRTFGWKAA